MDSPPPHVNWQTLQSTQSFQTSSRLHDSNFEAFNKRIRNSSRRPRNRRPPPAQRQPLTVAFDRHHPPKGRRELEGLYLSCGGSNSKAFPSQKKPFCVCFVLPHRRPPQDAGSPFEISRACKATCAVSHELASLALGAHGAHQPRWLQLELLQEKGEDQKTVRRSRAGAEAETSGRLVAGVTQRAQRANPRSCPRLSPPPPRVSLLSPQSDKRARLCAKSILYICL